ncbi:serine-threonine/tyrosine-protein kinase catalytic domain-containing protein [Tanacetum coccineum]
MSMVNEWQRLSIPFGEIIVATENFKTFIGEGGYGSVFKGKLLVSGKETMVAVKRLNDQSGQGFEEFLMQSVEVWIARGLDHLHHHLGGHQTIIHRDIKSLNILIHENWVAKISDLGLSKLGFGTSVTRTNACGTPGYCEPEYCETGFVTRKSDVYSFGVVLFEVLCGRLCQVGGNDGFTLTSTSAKYHYENNTLDKIIDQSLREYIGSDSMTKFAAIAYRCLHKREQRPAKR